ETSAGEAIRRAVLNGRVTLGDESGQTHSALIQDKDAQAPSEVAFRSAGRSDSDMSGALADKALPQIASILESRLRIR
ncbi:MAG: hypothetical protein KDB07_11200, partial [Planctomycetes bacterium]|nr:hypothetical protein [Planctomycetota bacterium]